MNRTTLPRAAFALALIVAPLAAASDAPTPTGKSAHGEAFDSGPRQAAVHMSGTGVVVFPVTTKSTEAQAFITQGVGLLHGFWYFEAERSFRQAAALDPDCAMAYWGMAFANNENDKRAKAFIAEAVKRKDKASPREQLYIDALNGFFGGRSRDAAARKALAAKYEAIAFKFPTDLEAKAFLLWQMWDNSLHGVPIESKLAMNALIGEVLAVEPRHPVHHYRVHLTNPNDDPTRAFASAGLCGPVAPGIPHMWHMPGHTYVDAKRFTDAAWQMEAAMRLENAHMMRMHMVPDENHLYVHNRGWLIDNLEFAGHVRDAIDLCKSIVELPRHPSYGKTSAAEARRKLYDICVRHERWDDLLALENTEYLEPTNDRVQEARRLVIFGRAELGRGNRSAAFARLTKLNDMCDEARKDVAKAWTESFGPNHLAGVVASAWAAGATPSPADFAVDLLAADRSLRKANAKANDTSIRSKLDVLRTLEQPAAELRGHIALANGGVKSALDWFAKAGNVDAEFLARIRAANGEPIAVDKLNKDMSSRVFRLANHVDLLQRAGKNEDARKEFAELRTLAGSADLDDPPLARLAPFASSLGGPADWRNPVAPKDIGYRPPLDSLGPFRWRGWQAPEWSLSDADGRIIHRSDYRGKPVVVIFYLGIGCVHCVEQLIAFTPKARDFAAAGIEVVAIGTDLPKTLKGADIDGKYPFTVLSDRDMVAFRAFGAFDDFEHLPLHATLLIDGFGQVRWQDIGAKPFDDPDFLLAEAKRLLKTSQ